MMYALTATSLLSIGVAVGDCRVAGMLDKSPISSRSTEAPAFSGDSRKGEREARRSLSCVMPSWTKLAEWPMFWKVGRKKGDIVTRRGEGREGSSCSAHQNALAGSSDGGASGGGGEVEREAGKGEEAEQSRQSPLRYKLPYMVVCRIVTKNSIHKVNLGIMGVVHYINEESTCIYIMYTKNTLCTYTCTYICISIM